MFGVMRLILEDEDVSISGDDDFFSVARTMPFVAIPLSMHAMSARGGPVLPLMPNDVTPWLTAFRAYSMMLSENLL